MPTVDRAVQIAATAHEGQRDKRGHPYILHPMRLMVRMSDDTARIVAALHDVVEDTDVTLDDLSREGFSEQALAAVDALTHRKHETYAQYIERLSSDPIARKVKIADLEDNMDMRQYIDLSDDDAARWRKYVGAWQRLTREE